MPFLPDHEGKAAAKRRQEKTAFTPLDLLDYVYAVLHSPAYRLKYREFLKIDFPRVPYPKDKKGFWALAKLGADLRALHLLESPRLEDAAQRFPFLGSDSQERDEKSHVY